MFGNVTKLLKPGLSFLYICFTIGKQLKYMPCLKHQLRQESFL